MIALFLIIILRSFILFFKGISITLTISLSSILIGFILLLFVKKFLDNKKLHDRTLLLNLFVLNLSSNLKNF